jgi:hypothetical protein
MKKLLMLLALSVCAFAQQYNMTDSRSFASAAAVWTVQLAANANRSIQFLEGSVSCPNGAAQCEVTIERDGTTATGTSIACAKINPSSTNTNADPSCFANSTSTGGTIISNFSVPGGSTQSFDLARLFFTRGIPTIQNLTVRIATANGVAKINVLFEQQR